MTVFNDYAQYYDLFYSQKDYKKESEFVDRLIRKYNRGASTVLELGCGTGSYAIALADLGYEITGVEISESMLKQARKKISHAGSSIQLYQGDIRCLELSEKFDVVLALFHVMSYQCRDSDFLSALRSARRHLKQDGILIFDCWYGPAVQKQGLERRVREVREGNIVVSRVAEPVHIERMNVAKVKYSFVVTDTKSKNKKMFNESHNMRYFSEDEIESMLKESGLYSEEVGGWMSMEGVDSSNWSIYVVARA